MVPKVSPWHVQFTRHSQGDPNSNHCCPSSTLRNPRTLPWAKQLEQPLSVRIKGTRIHHFTHTGLLPISVTFLATLFLLLFVSCAIVLRSYVLRRRFQRRLDEAMAAGILLAPRAQGSRKRRFGTKPKFFDAWIAEGGETWDGMMVCSVLLPSSNRCVSTRGSIYSLYQLSRFTRSAVIRTLQGNVNLLKSL